jgi:hypothetical protein
MTADPQKLADARALLDAAKRTVANRARAAGALDALDAIHVLDLEARVERLETSLRRRAAFERARELTTS